MAPSRAPVFITGESGTGKELCAEAIHQPFRPGRPALRRDQLQRHPEGADGERDLRPCARRLHRRHARTAPALPSSPTAARCSSTRSPRWTSRSRRSSCASSRPARSAGSAAASSGASMSASSRATNRDPARRGRSRPLPRRPLLPAPCPAHPPAAAPRAPRGHPAARRSVPRPLRRRGGPRLSRLRRGRRRMSPRPRLAGQCPPARERHPPDRRPPRRRGRSRPRCCRPRSATAELARRRDARLPPPARWRRFREQERTIIETALAAFGGNISRAAAALEISPSTIYRKRQELGGAAPRMTGFAASICRPASGLRWNASIGVRSWPGQPACGAGARGWALGGCMMSDSAGRPLAAAVVPRRAGRGVVVSCRTATAGEIADKAALAETLIGRGYGEAALAAFDKATDAFWAASPLQLRVIAFRRQRRGLRQLRRPRRLRASGTATRSASISSRSATASRPTATASAPRSRSTSRSARRAG